MHTSFKFKFGTMYINATEGITLYLSFSYPLWFRCVFMHLCPASGVLFLRNVQKTFAVMRLTTPTLSGTLQQPLTTSKIWA